MNMHSWQPFAYYKLSQLGSRTMSIPNTNNTNLDTAKYNQYYFFRRYLTMAIGFMCFILKNVYVS